MTTTSRVSDSREAFEKWAISQGMKVDLCPEFPGSYDWPGVQGRWECWQAALSTMGDVVAVGEIKALIATYDECYMTDPFSTSWFDVRNDLLALLSRGGL